MTKSNNQGSALIMLLFFMAIGVTVIGSTALILSANIAGSSTAEQGLIAYSAAESGIEDGIVHLLRNPSLSATLPTIPVGLGQVSTTISAGTVTATGTFNNTTRKITVQTVYTGGQFTVTSWKEIN